MCVPGFRPGMTHGLPSMRGKPERSFIAEGDKGTTLARLSWRPNSLNSLSSSATSSQRRHRISLFRHPVSMSSRRAVTADVDTPPPFSTSSNICPKRVNSPSVRNRSRLRTGYLTTWSGRGCIPQEPDPSPRPACTSETGWISHCSLRQGSCSGVDEAPRPVCAPPLSGAALPRAGTMWRFTTVRVDCTVLGLHRISTCSSRYRLASSLTVGPPDRPGQHGLGHRLLARLDPGDDQGRPLPRLLRAEHAVTAHRDPLRPPGPPGLGDIHLSPRGIDPHTKAR